MSLVDDVIAKYGYSKNDVGEIIKNAQAGLLSPAAGRAVGRNIGGSSAS